MDYRASFTIPANTPATAPVEQQIGLGHGVLNRVRIRIPFGHAALAHLRLYRWEHQLYPTSADRDYVGNNEVITIDDRVEVTETPYTLTAWGYNEDDSYPHTFELSFTVVSEEQAAGLPNRLQQLMAWVRSR